MVMSMENKFSVDIDNISYEYEIVKLCKRYNINYIIYKDNDDYYASRYNVVNGKIQLDEIENDYEWDFIDSELNMKDE